MQGQRPRGWTLSAISQLKPASAQSVAGGDTHASHAPGAVGPGALRPLAQGRLGQVQVAATAPPTYPRRGPANGQGFG